MSKPAVISINPATKTRGALLAEKKKYVVVTKRIKEKITVALRLKETLNFLTGIDSGTIGSVSGRLLILRIVSAIALASLSAYLWHIVGITEIGIASAVLGASILFGFMMRILSMSGTVVFGMMAYYGVADLTMAAALCFISVVFMILGPGIYSTDQCLRKSIFRAAQCNTAKNNMPVMGFDYKSYVRL